VNAGQRGNGRTIGEVFRWPAAVTGLTLVGLVAALVGDGWADALSVLCLAVVVAVLAVAWWR